MLRFVYVKFREQEQKDGVAMSHEPRKWHRILKEHIPYDELDGKGIRGLIRACWLSEYPTSLNLLVEDAGHDSRILDLLRPVFPGLDEIGFPDVNVQTPLSAEIMPLPQAA